MVSKLYERSDVIEMTVRKDDRQRPRIFAEPLLGPTEDAPAGIWKTRVDQAPLCRCTDGKYIHHHDADTGKFSRDMVNRSDVVLGDGDPVHSGDKMVVGS